MRPPPPSVMGLALAFLVAVAPPAGAVAPADLVPAEAVAVLRLERIPDLVQRWPKTPFIGLESDPAMAAFFAPLRQRIASSEVFELTNAGDQEELGALLAVLNGGAVVFIPSVAPSADTQTDDQTPPAVLVAQVDPERFPHLERLLMQRAEEGSDGAVRRATREFAGIPIHIERRDGADGPVDGPSWAAFDDLFAAATSPAELQRVIGDWRRGGAAQPLTSSLPYQSVSRHAATSDAFLYVNFERLLPPLRQELRESAVGAGSDGLPYRPEALLDALALDVLRAGFAACRLGGEGLDIDLGVTFTADRGLVKLLAYGPGEAPRPAFIPADAVAFGTVRFDFQRAWSAVSEIVDGLDPNLLAMASAQLAAAVQGADVELDLRRDVLDNLGGEVAMIELPETADPAATGTSAGPPAAQVIALSIRQRQSFELALETLKTMAGRGAELFSSRDYVGTTIYTLSAPGGGQSPSYALTSDYFLLSFGNAGALEAVLVAMRSPGASAWRQPAVSAVLARLPEGASGLSFQDLAVGVQRILQTLAQAAAMSGGGEMTFCDPGAVPSTEVLARYLGPAVTAVYKDDDSLVARFKVLPPAGAAQ